MTPPELAALRSPAAVRARSHRVLDHVRAGRSPHFTLDEAALGTVADYVVAVCRQDYPTLDIPYHSRWRHFSAGGIDRFAVLAEGPLAGQDARARARTMVDLAVVSVLLDAGAGDAWRYHEPHGLSIGRSEGLAVASLAMFAAGGFSSDPAEPLRVDAAGLIGIDAATLARFFQVSADNPLVGLEGRVALLNRLGHALGARPDLFGDGVAQPGGLVDALAAHAPLGKLPAAGILAALLDGLAPIWPAGLVAEGVELGDVGRHPAILTGDLSEGLVPFHKLSQWLTYSLLEPFEAAGFAVTGLDDLTGLPEYRNGGLFIDLGLLVPRAPLDPGRKHPVTSEIVVEWRALTVALLDVLADAVRERLGLSAKAFPLAKLLQGGTWTAGRRIAAERRPPAGPPPLAILADGTVF
ncbi:URC4/urg3 family protein [Ancylobacter sp. 6x-1]|uniref:URC4/urg3 family protein n=1 Tax=Ancylobacter crimeensis TaxID=2579147 RepID=A0ABT0D805_9HYPH|nr:URC4/urg3 family protein [Ancylobacter crimeensis]MCK0196077.1 URC4/urg3 family protein [Ancylobacter crimeensis]